MNYSSNGPQPTLKSQVVILNFTTQAKNMFFHHHQSGNWVTCVSCIIDSTKLSAVLSHHLTCLIATSSCRAGICIVSSEDKHHMPNKRQRLKDVKSAFHCSAKPVKRRVQMAMLGWSSSHQSTTLKEWPPKALAKTFFHQAKEVLKYASDPWLLRVQDHREDTHLQALVGMWHLKHGKKFSKTYIAK